MDIIRYRYKSIISIKCQLPDVEAVYHKCNDDQPPCVDIKAEEADPHTCQGVQQISESPR